MNTLLQSYDYTIMLIKKEKKTIISRSGELKIVLDYQLDKIRTVIFHQPVYCQIFQKYFV